MSVTALDLTLWGLVMLLGRERECARLGVLVSQVRAGSSAAVVVKGEPGIGKTCLIQHALSNAGGLEVLQTRGVESEQNLPFAGLADLLRPILGYLPALPAPQKAALASALAVGPVVSAEPFTICAATLSLLSAAAVRRPVLAVVDDAHWLDAASAQAVEFAARRLGQEAVGLVIAVREGTGGAFDAAWIESLVIPGLDGAAVRELLAGTGRRIASPVVDRLIEGVGGNPLALLELAATLSDRELGGLASLPEPLPLAATLQGAFTKRLTPLAPAARRMLLLAAADATADLPTLQSAAQLLSLNLGDLSAAEEADIVRVGGGGVEFAHPLLRSVTYHAATAADRRTAHRALAECIDPGSDPIRHAWHLAAATAGPDEGVAERLDVAASVARGRNAFVAASRAHQRAAELTADRDRQVARWMAAGQAAHLGGDLASAVGLLGQAAAVATNPCVRADAQVMRAHATVWAAPLKEHYDELVAQAEAVLPFDQDRAATLLALGAGLCGMIGQFSLAAETASRAAGMCRSAAGIPWLLSHTMLAQASILTGQRATGRQIITAVLDHRDLAQPDPALHLLRMLCGQALIWCEDNAAAAELLRSVVGSGRALGRVADLPYGLAASSDLEFRTGNWGQARADADEAVELAGDFGTTNDLCYALACAARVEAAMGAAEPCRAHLDRALCLARPAGLRPTVMVYAAAALGLLDLGLGHYEDAVAELTRAASITAQHALADPCVVQWRPEFIEGLIRVGRLADAREQLAVLDAEAASTSSRWATVTAGRCRGLLQDTSKRAIDELEHAVALAVASANYFEQARTRLCLGEALRRARQRRQARLQLQEAQMAFELLGAQPWAERAADELAATGITSVPRRKPIHTRLTPQELRVALQVAGGLSNQEVASRLFLSHKTIEVHLSHIYAKLGVHSRTSLANLMRSRAGPARLDGHSSLRVPQEGRLQPPAAGPSPPR